MRLYLTVYRGNDFLPQEKSVVWPVAATIRTVGQLIDDISKIFPPHENEHYIIILKGFQCLPFHDISVLQHEDEVLVCPVEKQESQVSSKAIEEHAQEADSDGSSESEEGTSSDESEGQESSLSEDSDTSSNASSEESSEEDSSDWTGLSPKRPTSRQTTSTVTAGIPYAGLSRTQARNQRRRLSKKLSALKAAGLLNEDATFEDLHNKDLLIGDATADEDMPTELEMKRESLLQAIATEGGIDVTDELEPPPAKRAKLDLASSNRMIFGSLGVRPPRKDNVQEKESLRSRLANIRQSRVATNPAAGSEVQVVEEEEEDKQEIDWRSCINLRAVECCDEGVELSEPPFPFRQRWDPQYSRKKRKQRNSIAVEKYNGTSDYLEYDEPPEIYSSHPDLEEYSQLEADDFPPLPDATQAVPLEEEKHANVNDYILFNELVCSAENSYQPSWMTRTAQLQSKSEDGSWVIKMALSDMPQVDYDDEGNRVYGKFEVPQLGDSDDRIRTMQWSELVEPRLLLRLNGQIG